MIERLLDMLGWKYERAELIREQAGVTVARVFSGGETAILKAFGPGASQRELENYRMLEQLGVETLRVLAECGEAFIMEDMASPRCRYRLAEEAHMADVEVARALGKWYRRLHDGGYGYVKAHGRKMYSEMELFTRANIREIRRRSGLSELDILEDKFDGIQAKISAAPMTITYNDFYYTNMAVAREGRGAIMFDYNLMGKGHAYADIRNVCWSLSPEAGAAFRESYGARDFALEMAIDRLVSPIVTLHMAYMRKNFPDWAISALEEIKTDCKAAVAALL